jgi:hypothetical protein
MKLDKLAAVAEIVSSIAIVVTLIYLAIQTHQNTAAIQGTLRQSMLTEDRKALYALIEHPSLELRCNLSSEQDTQLRAYMIANHVALVSAAPCRVGLRLRIRQVAVACSEKRLRRGLCRQRRSTAPRYRSRPV